MAMTLRLEEQDDLTLTELAARYGVSKHQAVLLALRATGKRELRAVEMDAIADRVIRDWAPVLEALART